MRRITANLLRIGILAALAATAANSATPPMSSSPDAETAKSILAQLLAIDTT
jgi:hypothetical protein